MVRYIDKRNRIRLVSSTGSNFMTIESQFDLSTINKKYFSKIQQSSNKNTRMSAVVIGIL